MWTTSEDVSCYHVSLVNSYTYNVHSSLKIEHVRMGYKCVINPTKTQIYKYNCNGVGRVVVVQSIKVNI